MIKAAQLSRELTVTAANKIGVLADISGILSERGINIEAVVGYALGQEARIILVSSDTLQAGEALKKSGYQVISENEVIVAELENKPGALKHITAVLAGAGIDIKEIYGTTCTCSAGCPARIVLSTVNNAKALAALKK